jgi:hypothetical protein
MATVPASVAHHASGHVSTIFLTSWAHTNTDVMTPICVHLRRLTEPARHLRQNDAEKRATETVTHTPVRTCYNIHTESNGPLAQ